jgi:hypothetical protein
MFLAPNARLLVSTLDGYSDFILPAAALPFRLQDGRLFRVRAGCPTDGLTSPKFIKLYLQDTNSFFPAVAHDAFYRGFIEQNVLPACGSGISPDWTRQQFTKDYADAALLELCLSNGVSAVVSQMIFDAVQEFGLAAWNADAPLREAQFDLPRAS